MKVLNFGSLNIDYVYTVDHMVAAGETLASSGMNVFCGGKGLNQSIALARAGAPVFHAGMIGPEGGVLLDACRLYPYGGGKIRTHHYSGGPVRPELHPAVRRRKPGRLTGVCRRGPGLL